MRTLAKALTVAAVAVAASVATASAQVGLAVAGGPSMPMGALGDVTDTGFNAQVSASLSLPLLPIGARIDGTFNQFPSSGGGANVRVVSGSFNGILSIPSIGITPYLIGGVGIYNTDNFAVGAGSSETKVGINGGAGVRIGLPGLPAVFGEARLHNVSSDGDALRFVPVSVGIRF